MAKTPSPSKQSKWEVDYRDAVREYGAGFVEISLRRAINSCMARLMERGLDCTVVEYRSCLTALMDLLVLRSLHYTYDAGRARSLAEG